MPVALIILIAGLVLRFGVAGFNTLGDILIWIGAAIIAVQLAIIIGVVNTARRF